MPVGDSESARAERVDPYCLEEGEADRLLAGHPWKRFALFEDSVAEGLGDPVPGYLDQSWADRLATALKRHAPGMTRPVLLAHGWQSRGTCFEHFVPGLLKAGYSPVAYDAPGHGDAAGATTTVLAFREVIQHLADEHGAFEAVISHSVGALASVLALRSGVRTRRLVTIRQVGEFTHLFDEFCGRLALRRRVRGELRTRVEQRLFPREQDLWRDFSTTYASGRITVPVLVVHDGQDRVVGVDQARRTAEVFGDQAHLVTTRGLGHRRILSGPAVVESILDFVTAAQDGPAEVPAASR
ncbi:alpha/beta fold hydrolase [Streptomyces sp. TG1A-8]|uniref:alpha/beta fold hydrolase n=1 Tax=Streptomyces sp. TG1A-8 TaxID=3051385 RepID=UPI00265BB4C2|nr:alpha/beta fold hydrolase [Streptomyces sp. TG1A-8]MDO0929468.1 alpha/beta fold hydrolase [Streptomyces sp. TG1A-8]